MESQGSLKRNAVELEREHCEEEAEVREERRCYAVSFEGGGKGHRPRNVGGLEKLEKAMR